MSKKYIMVSMDDERAGKIADVLSNKTSKKIIDLLSEKEASEKEIADKLNIPINTAEYNIKKLLDAELIEKAKHFFWSSKGKKIPMYKLSNKSILISPKRRISSQVKVILPVAIISTILALIVRQLTIPKVTDETFDKIEQEVVAGASSLAAEAPASVFTLSQIPIWIWFWLGTIVAIVVLTLIELKGGRTTSRG